MIPCPISEATPVWDVLPEANRAIMDSLDYFIVENTRSARRFLSKAGVKRKIEELEFVELNEHTTDAREVERMLKPVLEGRSAGVISEAGVPGVAAPGAAIAALAHRHGVRVVPLVGPSSILMSVMASGLNGQSFAFVGYLPIKDPERQRRLKELERRAMSTLGRKVRISRSSKKKIDELTFDDDADLEALLLSLCGNEIFNETV